MTKGDLPITVGRERTAPVLEKTSNLLIVQVENSNRSQIDWELQDPMHLLDAEFRAVRDRIEGLVSDLLVKAAMPSGSGAASRS